MRVFIINCMCYVCMCVCCTANEYIRMFVHTYTHRPCICIYGLGSWSDYKRYIK